MVYISSLSQYSWDIRQAFERLGWDAHAMSEEALFGWIQNGPKPDLVLNNILNPATDQLCEQRKINHAIWTLDSWYQSPNLLGDEQQAQAVALGFPTIDSRVPFIPDGKHLWNFSVSQELLPMLKGQAQVYLPFGVNELRFKPMPEVQKKYEIGFVGTSLLGQDHIDGVTMLELANIHPSMIGNIEDIPTRVSWQMLVGMRESALARVKACQDLKAHVWGDGWDGVEGVTLMGKTDFRNGLPITINECQVSLNISRGIFPLDLCPRLFEVLSCNGMLLSNRLPGIEAEFGEHVAFLDNPDAATWEGRPLILAKHTWVKRVEAMLGVIGL